VVPLLLLAVGGLGRGLPHHGLDLEEALEIKHAAALLLDLLSLPAGLRGLGTDHRSSGLFAIHHEHIADALKQEKGTV
jgi:hypothetical protein